MSAAPPADTIVAPATPPGTGGIGIVRISGPLAATIAETMLGMMPEPRYATPAEFHDDNRRPVDSGLALWFPGPASFTGEDVLELQCHGGPTVIALLVDAAIHLGARRAEPGEFSQRAFLNGKLDLAQAEAVADLIESGTEQAARAAHRSLSGEFSRTVDALAEQLVKLRLHVEAAIDFPEEEIDFLSDKALLEQVETCADAFGSLMERTRTGRLLRDGLQVVIVGRPNAGKSSLLNLLSGQEAAIVTEVAGTTRDILRERINIDGLAVELVDTAGLREDPDAIEAEGIRRARQALEGADVVLWIRDASDEQNDTMDESLPEGVPVLIVRNKIDLTDEETGSVEGEGVINLSAVTGAGVDALQAALRDLAGYCDQGEGAFTARERHVEALDTAIEHFRRGQQALNDAQAGELFAEELKLAQQSLGTITGAMTSDDLLGRIFAEFCIGK
jgi:tRNA modification GTPase